MAVDRRVLNDRSRSFSSLELARARVGKASTIGCIGCCLFFGSERSRLINTHLDRQDWGAWGESKHLIAQGSQACNFCWVFCCLLDQRIEPIEYSLLALCKGARLCGCCSTGSRGG